MNNEAMMTIFDWEASKTQFKKQVEQTILQALQEGKVLTLPLTLGDMDRNFDLMLQVLSQVNCTGCDAHCCKSNPDGEPIEVFPYECEAIIAQHGARARKHIKHGQIQMPCPFLVNNRCTIYPERPFICALYPVQPGGFMGRQQALALAAECPEARRIFRSIYLARYELRKVVKALLEHADQVKRKTGEYENRSDK